MNRYIIDSTSWAHTYTSADNAEENKNTVV